MKLTLSAQRVKLGSVLLCMFVRLLVHKCIQSVSAFHRSQKGSTLCFVCGHCLGLGTLSVLSEVDGAPRVTTVQCPNCEGSGTVVCINCQGSGLSVPDEFLQVLGDEEVGFTEEDFIGLFDETPIPKSAPPAVAATPAAAKTAVKTAAAPEVAKMPQEPAVGSRPEDFLGSG